jgi:hypothetical protein
MYPLSFFSLRRVAELQGDDMDDSLLFIEDDTGGIAPLHGFID